MQLLDKAQNFLIYLVNPRSRLISENPVEEYDELADSGGFTPGLTRPNWWKRIRTNLPLLVGLFIMLGLFIAILIGPFVLDYDPYITAQSIVPYYDSEIKRLVSPPFEPSSEYPLGTDEWGNDMLSLLIFGARVTLFTAAFITLSRLLIGVAIGAIAGWQAEKRVDGVAMAAIATISSVPILLSGFLLILILDARNGAFVFVIALSIVGWTEIAQYTRGETLNLRGQPYMEAAASIGLTEIQMVVRHALPNILPKLLVIVTLEMAAVLLLLAELGYLGVYIGGASRFAMDPIFGPPPETLMPVPEWGGLVARGVGSFRSNPHRLFAPAAAFFIAIVGLNFLGEGLRQLFSRSSVNTGVLLSKRAAVAFVVLAIISVIIIRRTGPIPSYVRLASQLEANSIIDEAENIRIATVDGITNVSEPSNLLYMAERFKELEVDKGWRRGIRSSYITEETEANVILGFFPGYDYDLAQELIVVFGQAPGIGSNKIGGANFDAAVMLELARIWNANGFDSRRSILFIAWGDYPFDPASAQNFLDNEVNYGRLPIPVRYLSATPIAIIHVDFTEIGNRLWFSPESNDQLQEIMSESARQAGIKLLKSDEIPASATPVISTKYPSVYVKLFSPQDSDSGHERIIYDMAGLADAGRMLAITLMKLANQRIDLELPSVVSG